MDKLRQRQVVLRHLEAGGSLTSLEALHLYGIARLGARVCELRKAGYDIEKETECGVTRDGSPCHWARYRMRKGETNETHAM